MGKGQPQGQFRFQTLEEAATTARDRAIHGHRRHFVVADGAAVASAARFGVVAQEELEALILRAAETDRARLAILRVATPDGAMETVDDSGDREGRLVAFCTSA
jgi:hypothetical protein